MNQTITLPIYLRGNQSIKKHRSALTNTVNHLDLMNRWNLSEDEAIETLVAKLVISHPDIHEVEFQVESGNPTDAPAVANRIADQIRKNLPGSEEVYQSRVILQVNRELHDWRIFDEGHTSGVQTISENFINNEMEIMKSQKVLYSIVNELKLKEKWGVTRREALNHLRTNLTYSRIDGTDLIAIEYFGSNPILVRDIAQSVATFYKERRERIESGRSGQALDMLNKQLKDQSDRVEEARLRMLDLAERYRIVDLAALQGTPLKTGDPVTGRGEVLMQSMQDTYAAESEIAKTKMQIETLRNLQGDELIQSASMLDIDHPILNRYYPSYQDLLLEKQTLVDAGAKEEELESISGQIDRVKIILDEAVVSIQRTLTTKMNMANEALNLATQIEEGKKDQTMDERRNVAEYAETNKEYELQKNMLASMQAKFRQRTH